jgi:hypothetical protein
MPTLHVKRGIEFRPDLYNGQNRNAWLEAVGKELETKGLTIKVGEGANVKEVKNGAELVAAYADLQKAASAAGSTLRGYIGDLMQALDDVVKQTSTVARGDAFDFSAGSDLSKALGLTDGKATNYASMQTTEFGKAARTRPENTMNVAGTMLAAKISAAPPPPAPDVDLTNVPHMSAQTLANAPVGYGRDGEEVEDTRVITGITKEQTVALAGSALNDLQRPRAAAGLTVGLVSLDDMQWDSEAHALRRANPYVSFTLDNRSYEVNPNNGSPRVAIGRDFFVDAFMAKKDVKTGKLTKDLQKAGLMYRARIRYGSDRDPFQGTRVLIGMKQGTAIDAAGTKHAKKIDSRTDSANQQIFDSLIKDAQTGKLSAGWGSWSTGQVPPASSSMYRAAVQAGITDNVGGENNVLAMDTGAVARQIRGRFHLNETSQAALTQAFTQAGEPKIKELVDLITAAPDFAANNGLPSKAELLAQANALLDRSAIVAACGEGMKKLDPNIVVDKALIDRLWIGLNVTDKKDAKLQRVVADAIRTTYDAFAENIDELQRKIGGNEDRSVRDAGSATDVRDFLREKAAVGRFMAYAERASGSGVTAGQTATYKAYADKLLAMPEGREKTDLFQAIGIGVNMLRDMTEVAFASVVKVTPELSKKQTFDAFIKEVDTQLAGPNKDAFIAELGAALGNDSPLGAAADKAPVLANIRKNLVAAHAEVLHRQIEGAAGWAQAAWFNEYRQTMINVNPQSWNFLIGSMDYTEFFNAETGLALTFQERVSRRPLDAGKMTGAMLSNDFQIELEAEEGYTAAVGRAQYAVNAALGGLLQDFALSKSVPGVVAGDAASFENWFSAQMSASPGAQKLFSDELAAFAASKGSPIDVAMSLQSLKDQEHSITVLTNFAKQKDPALNAADRTAVEAWYRAKAGQPAAELEKFLTEVAQFASDHKSDIPLSPNLLKTLDFEPFAPANAGRPVDGHAQLADDLAVAQEIWAMVKKSTQDLSVARGQEIQRVLRDNDIRGAGWDPPTKAKGDYGIDYSIG